jgi:hypothetical protein
MFGRAGDAVFLRLAPDVVFVRQRHRALVAQYCAALPAATAVAVYAEMLAPVTAAPLRRDCLRWASDAGLDVAAIVRSAAAAAASAAVSALAEPLPGSTAEGLVMAAVGALDWLAIDPAHRAAALLQGNALARVCLGASPLAFFVCVLLTVLTPRGQPAGSLMRRARRF